MKPFLGLFLIGAALAGGTAIGEKSTLRGDLSGLSPRTIPIYFPDGATRLTPEAQDVLDETAKRAREAGGTRLVVVGYAAGTDPKTRDRIASERASIVETGLVSRGIDPRAVHVAVPVGSFVKAYAKPFIDSRRADVIIETNMTSGF